MERVTTTRWEETKWWRKGKKTPCFKIVADLKRVAGYLSQRAAGELHGAPVLSSRPRK